MKDIFYTNFDKVDRAYVSFNIFYALVLMGDIYYKTHFWLSFGFVIIVDAILAGLLLFLLINRKMVAEETFFTFLFWSIFMMVFLLYPVVEHLQASVVYNYSKGIPIPVGHLLAAFTLLPYIDKKSGGYVRPGMIFTLSNALYLSRYLLVHSLFIVGLFAHYSIMLSVLYFPSFFYGIVNILTTKPEDYRNMDYFAKKFKGRKS